MSKPSRKSVDVAKTILSVYPDARDCLNGHIGNPKLTFFEEPDDDRYYLLVVKRCGHCGVPVGGDDYANEENTKRFYAGLQPLSQ